MFLALLVACSGRGITYGNKGSTIEKFSFVNNCGADVYLEDWKVTIPAGQTKYITTQRSTNYQRISFKPAGSNLIDDFIELNGDWSGINQKLYGHVSYSTYNGFNMASKYEALSLTDDTKYACGGYPGAAVLWASAWTDGNCKAGMGYTCQGNVVCYTTMSEFMYQNSYCIQSDGSMKQHCGNYWCNEVNGFPNHGITGVGTLIQCVDKGIPFHLRVTVCPEGKANFAKKGSGSSSDVVPAPIPAPAPPTTSGTKVCVPKTKTRSSWILNDLVYACGQVSCADVPASCTSAKKRGTYVMSKYYALKKSAGATCDFRGDAYLTANPKYGSCVYQG